MITLRDFVPEWMFAYLGVYALLCIIALSVIAMMGLYYKVSDSRAPRTMQDFVATRLYDPSEPRLYVAKGWWHCIGYVEGERIVGKGKTEERARASYEKRLDAFLAELEQQRCWPDEK